MPLLPFPFVFPNTSRAPTSTSPRPSLTLLTQPSYIHGGAWRDPTRSYEDLAPTLRALTSSPPLPIAGLASIDYRLSPHPSHPQPVTTPPTQLRRAVHPDHIHDIRAALAHLSQKRSIEGYILAGHSVGATLAFQLLMGPQASGTPLPHPDVPLPAGILGLAGIYEFRDFASRNGDPYVAFVENALGPDRETWDAAAPMNFKGSYAADWAVGRHVLLSYSEEDTLVDGVVETGAMVSRLQRDGRAVSTSPTNGEHEFVWEDGKQIVRLIGEILQKVRGH